MNSGRAVLWSRNRRSKWDLEIKPKKTRNPQKRSTTQKPNASFCSKKKVFGQNKRSKNEFFDGLGLLAFLWPKICNDNSKNTIKQGGFVFLLCLVGRCCPNKTINQKTTTIKTRTSNHNKTTIMGPQNQANKKSNTLQKTTTTPNPTGKYTIEQLVLLFFGGFLWLLLPKQPKQNNRSTKQ